MWGENVFFWGGEFDILIDEGSEGCDVWGERGFCFGGEVDILIGERDRRGVRVWGEIFLFFWGGGV